MKLSLFKLFQFCINFTHSDSPAHFLWAARASVQHWGAGAGPSSLYRRRSYKLLWVTSSTGVLHWAVRNCRCRRVPNPVEPCGSATTGSLRRQRSFSRNSQNMLPGICAATAKNWPKNPKYSTGLRESQKWSSWSQNYGNCKRLKMTFLGKFVLLTEGQYWSVNIFGLCIDTFCACGCAWKDGAEGWVALHYNRPRATSGIHGVAGRVRYRLCQYRGDRKSMPSPCQVADVPLGQLEIKCFNILVSQTTSRIS